MCAYSIAERIWLIPYCLLLSLPAALMTGEFTVSHLHRHRSVSLVREIFFFSVGSLSLSLSLFYSCHMNHEARKLEQLSIFDGITSLACNVLCRCACPFTWTLDSHAQWGEVLFSRSFFLTGSQVQFRWHRHFSQVDGEKSAWKDLDFHSNFSTTVWTNTEMQWCSVILEDSMRG